MGGQLSTRWMYWGAAMVPFCYIVCELLFGLAGARSSEPNDKVKALVFRSQWVTVVSWLTCPVVYVFPMLGLSGSSTVVAIQCGYCASDIISKCGVGLIIYSITAAKSEIEEKGPCCPSETESEFDIDVFWLFSFILRRRKYVLARASIFLATQHNRACAYNFGT